MQVSQIRAARWAITGGLAAFLAIAAAGFPTQARAFVCNGQFDILQKGYCSTTITQGSVSSFHSTKVGESVAFDRSVLSGRPPLYVSTWAKSMPLDRAEHTLSPA